jgi:hypothetical protein
MANMSNYLENKLIDHIFRGVQYTMPTTLAFGLMTATPSDPGGGTEVSGGGYARVALNPSTTNWQDTAGGTAATSSGTTGTTKNNADVTFPTPSADWGQIVGMGLYDSSTAGAGNLLFWSPLANAKNINNGDPAPKFATAAFTCQIDN